MMNQSSSLVMLNEVAEVQKRRAAWGRRGHKTMNPPARRFKNPFAQE